MIITIDEKYGKLKVFIQKRYEDGNLIGVKNSNPTLNSRVYTVKFDDKTLCEYASNLIVKNMYDHVNDEG